MRTEPKVNETEIEQRLRIAREYKATTGGKLLLCDVFGEPEPKYLRTPKPRTQQVREDTREYQKRWQLNHKIAVAKRRQRECGGTYGITADYHVSRGVEKFRSHVGSTKVFRCAIDAAEHRNSVMKHRYPGVVEFQVDIDAVWRKWGCNCGMHRRPNG